MAYSPVRGPVRPWPSDIVSPIRVLNKPIKGGLYVFYLFETLLGLYQKFKTEREIEKSEHPTPNRGARSRSQRQSESCAQTGNHHLAILDEPKVEECYDEDCETNLENAPLGGAGEHWVNEKADSIEKREKFDEPLLAGHGHAHGHGFGGHGHSHGGHGHSHGLDGIAMVGWMVILGDGLHNFADGLGKYRKKGRFWSFSAGIYGFCSKIRERELRMVPLNFYFSNRCGLFCVVFNWAWYCSSCVFS